MKLAKGMLRALVALLATLALVVTAVYYKVDESGIGASGEQTTITIAYLPITHAVPLFKAAEQLEQQNSNVHVELVKYGGWAELMDALDSGRVDGASVLIEMAMEAKSQGIPLELSLLGHRDGNVIIASNDIASPAQLKGKIIAIPNEQSSHNILIQQLLNKYGMSEKDVTLIEMAPAEMPAGLKSGQIDGYCVAEPFGAKAVETGVGHVLATSDELWENSICCGIVFNTQATAGKQEALKTFKQAYLSAGNSLTKDEAVQIAVNNLGQDEATSQQSLQWISFNDLSVTEEAYERLRQEVIEYGLNDNPPTYDEFVAKN